jgi:hypothetical protein
MHTPPQPRYRYTRTHVLFYPTAVLFFGLRYILLPFRHSPVFSAQKKKTAADIAAFFHTSCPFALHSLNLILTHRPIAVRIISEFFGGLAQLARVPDWQSGGREFESHILHQKSSFYRAFLFSTIRFAASRIHHAIIHAATKIYRTHL